MSGQLRVVVAGASGRMGHAVCSVAQSTEEMVIAATLERGTTAPSPDDYDVIVDFTQADATAEICRVSVAAAKPLVCGTTGHSVQQFAELQRAAQSVAVVHAANFSVGVNALFSLTRLAADLLGDEFDLEIVETHHRSKKDAPSGTAKRLLDVLQGTRALTVLHGRQGITGTRRANEIGIHAVRGGDVVGDHTVIFAGRGERVELTHRASNRETFAIGAMRAARWVVGKPPGLYSMEDVLGLTSDR